MSNFNNETAPAPQTPVAGSNQSWRAWDARTSVLPMEDMKFDERPGVLTPFRIKRVQRVIKRLFDIIVAAVGLLVFSPLMFIIAMLIRMESSGPALFRQWRPGFRGHKFQIIKFRSMDHTAEELEPETPEINEEYLSNGYKIVDDPRLSGMGALLRKSSLDEIPQLINVLRGDMSLVGPRPVVGPELMEYGDAVPLLLSMRPGITGQWQVNGRSAVGYPERAELDLDYIRNWSLTRDVMILLKTFPAVIRGHGAH